MKNSYIRPDMTIICVQSKDIITVSAIDRGEGIVAYWDPQANK